MYDSDDDYSPDEPYCYDYDDDDDDYYLLTERFRANVMRARVDVDHMVNEPSRQPDVAKPSRQPDVPLPLIDICASKIALNFPFAYIENRTPPVPENVQIKIISYSFPQHLDKIKRYCSFTQGSSSEFDKAVKIVKSVKDLTQIGFHLSANVECQKYGSRLGIETHCLYITIKFDRGKITEANCPCENTSSWCFHVIAVCLARISHPNKCVVRPPLSDSLNNLTSYQQLRTFTQYLITEFSDQRIVESAQNILDRMLKPETADSDEINETWGAPDPTAGPGLNETCQWLICEQTLKCGCTSLLRRFDFTEGSHDTDAVKLSRSVMEGWKMSQIEEPVVDDYFNNLENIPDSASYTYNQCKRTYSRGNSQEITKFLKNCEDLIRDDFVYSLKAIQTFTAQLVDVIVVRNDRNFRTSYGDRSAVEKFESDFYLGCIPRPQTCWLVRDQLARLWRLLVLNLSISVKKREEIFTTLENFRTKLHSIHFYPELWDSLENIQHLKNFTWEKLQLADDPFKDDGQVYVLTATVIEYRKDSSKTDHAKQFPYPVDLICGEFCSSVTVYCSLIEALSVYGRKEQAVHLAINVTLAIVRFYASWCRNEGKLTVEVKATLSVNNEDITQSDTDNNVKGVENVQRKRQKIKRKKGKRGTADAKKAGEANEKIGNNLAELFDQIKGIIPITSVAYLLDILQKNQELVAEMLKLVKFKSLGFCDDDLVVYGDVTNAQSLIFCLGVIGVAMPKLQAPSLQTQVEWFNWEVYISDKIMKLSPSSGDVCFLKDMTFRMIHLCEFGFHPSYALVMNLFQHSYKPEFNQLDGDAEHGFSVALDTMVASPWKPGGVNYNRRTFFESLRRHWVKLCETVLCRVSVCPTELSRFLESLFTATAMIGSTSEHLNTKDDNKTIVYSNVIQSMTSEKIVANVYLAYALVSHADSLKTAADLKSRKRKQVCTQKPVEETGVSEFEVTVQVEGRMKSISEQRELLYETAITLASRAFAVKNVAFVRDQLPTGTSLTSDRRFREFMHHILKWMCDISNMIGVKAFDLIFARQRLQFRPVKCFNDDEVLKLCTAMLKSEQKREDRVWLIVKDALLTLIRPQSEKKISDILSLCRDIEKESPSKRVLLVPAICKELLTYIPGSSMKAVMKAEQLARAMMTMQTLIKNLESDDEEDILEGVKELFSETLTSATDKPGTSHDSSETLDLNLQLCFDLAIETIKHSDIDDRTGARGFETFDKRRFENVCNVIVFVAKRAINISGEQSAEAGENAKIAETDPFEDIFVSQFIESLGAHVKDCLLLSDFFFELASNLLGWYSQHRSFGRDGVRLSDDCKIAKLCQSCQSLSGLLKRCIAGLLATTHGEIMENYLKDTTRKTYDPRVRAKHEEFYCRESLVSVLKVLKRLMSISDEDNFEAFSVELSSKHPIVKVAIEELTNESTSSSLTFQGNMLASLLLRQWLNPFQRFAYDSDDSEGGYTFYF